MRWFPYSSFLVRPFGLHLSDHSVALLRLSDDRRIAAIARREISDGVIERGVVRDRATLVAELRSLFAEARPKPVSLEKELPVIFSIPESESFTHIFTIPSATPKHSYAEAVRMKAAHLIPVDIDTLYWDWSVVSHNVGAMDRVFFAAARKEVVDGYIAVFTECNLVPVAIDMETVALARAFLPTPAREGALDDGAVVIADVGRRLTTLGFFDGLESPALSLVVPVAGDAFTLSLVKHLGLSESDAEAHKRAVGMEQGHGDDKTIVVLQERIQELLREYNKASSYFTSVYARPVRALLLAGGSSLLPGLLAYLSVNLRHSVSVGDPLVNLSPKDPMRAELPTPLLFAPVIGLALHALHSHPEEGINLLHGWEGERWEAREHSILRRWRKLALPIFVASMILLTVITVLYIILPYRKVMTANISRIAPIPEEHATSSTDALSASTTPESATATSSSFSNISEDTATTSVDTSTTTRIRVTETPTGWLNVRSGPGTSFAIVTRITPGEEFVVLEEEGEWIKLELPALASGWVTRQYVTNTHE